LGPDHVGKVCDDHLNVTDAEAVRVGRELWRWMRAIVDGGS